MAIIGISSLYRRFKMGKELQRKLNNINTKRAGRFTFLFGCWLYTDSLVSLRQYANVCTPPLALSIQLLSTGQSELFIVLVLFGLHLHQ